MIGLTNGISRRFAGLRWIGLALFIGLLAVAPVRAAAPEVKDEAKFFSASAVEKANGEIAAINRKYRKDLLIETLESPPADQAEKFAKPGRTRDEFYNAWARERARKARVNGIYVLITKKPGHVEVEVGNETQRRAFTLENRNKLRDILLDGFKKNEHDKGLLEGVRYVDRTISENEGGAAHPKSELAPVAQRGENHNVPGAGGGMGMSWIIWAVIILIGFFILRGLFRALTGGGARPGYGGGYGPGPGGPGPGPGWGGGGGGGGFLTNMVGGIFGAAAGNWLYDSFFRGGSGMGGGFSGGGGSFTSGRDASDGGVDTDYSGTGGDYDDSSRTDSGGGDSGGGDFGGGDFGGDSGGGDFGGGGGDFA
jgi:hypothetical protein